MVLPGYFVGLPVIGIQFISGIVPSPKIAFWIFSAADFRA